MKFFIVFRIFGLVQCFSPDALADATLTIFPDLEPVLKICWFVTPSGGSCKASVAFENATDAFRLNDSSHDLSLRHITL